MRSHSLPAGAEMMALATILTLAAPEAPAQTPSPYATRVVAYHPGPGVGKGFEDPRRALGAPKGLAGTQQSLDVVTLGEGGSLTLGFDQPLTNGPGADFIVFENAFFAAVSIRSFAEVVFVEVSTNGQDFARFPASYAGPSVSLGPFGALEPGTWNGLAGTTPVFANPDLFPDVDPRDPARAGGDAFDLETLRDHPLVKAGSVNLFWISYVRLVDVPDGRHKDARGRLIRDAAPGSADVDGVAVLHFLKTRSPHNPEATLSVTGARHVRLVLRDPDGLGDLEPSRLHVSVQGLPLDFWAFAGLCRVVYGDSKGFVLETVFQVPRDLTIKLSSSARDRGGLLAGSTVGLH